MTSAYRIIRSEATKLPKCNGDRDFTVQFDSPHISSERTREARPYLSYRVNPENDQLVRLVIELNGTTISDQTLGTPVARSFDEVFEHDVLNFFNNELRMFVPNDKPGSVTVSNIIVVYTTEEPELHEGGGGPL